MQYADIASVLYVVHTKQNKELEIQNTLIIADCRSLLDLLATDESSPLGLTFNFNLNFNLNFLNFLTSISRSHIIHMETPNFDTDLPRYFPVHLSLRVNTEFSSVLLLNQIDDQLLMLKRTTDQYLDYVGSNPQLVSKPECTRFLNTQLTSFVQLFGAKFRLQTLQSALKTAHREFVDSRRHEQDLSLANYHVYQDVDKANFADRIVDELHETLEGPNKLSFDEILRADSMYQYLKNAQFVLENPEDPIPEDQENEELAVAGGKISLKDPLSLNYFVEPMISRKCGHVFEREHIMKLLEAHLQINCPVTGCQARVSRADLREDKLMALRVKVHRARDRPRREKSPVVRI